MNKDKILAELPELSLEDLTIIHAIASKLIQGRSMGQTNKASTLAALCFEALSGPLNVTGSYASRATTKWGIQFEKKVPDLAKWLDLHFVGWADNKVSQLAFLQLLFTMMANDLKRRNLPRSLAMAVTNLDQIPRIFESAFPGYLESGLGKLIMERFQKPL